MNNLPAEFSSFVGRHRELSEVRRLLSASRLLTLTGVGGVGKTRLSLRVGTEVRRSFPDGVWLVELAALTDQALVPQAVSDALAISSVTPYEPVEVLTDYLADRRLLLILDNCEHLLPACAVLATELLRAAPGLRILATSREALGIPGEYVYPLAPLPAPDPDEPLPDGASLRYPALALFAERAAAVSPGFTVTSDNAALVARVCHRLDGIPLAIELAAVRLRSLSLAQVAARLDDRFGLLTTGNRAALPRHQTLRAAVEWSFDLCTEAERLLWVRASVFSGRFDLDAAAAVCGGDGLDPDEVYEPLANLVEKSVLFAEEHAGGLRYGMLETVRQSARERLCDTPGEAVLRRRHRDHYLELAERFHADWFGPRQPEWTRQMRAELPNLRQALGYSLDTPGEEPAGVRLAGALYYFWYACGESREGRYWTARALAADPYPGPERVRTLAAYARLLILQGVPAVAVDVGRGCLDLARRMDEPFYVSHLLQTLGLGALYTAGPAEALPLLEEAVTVAGKLGPTHPALAYTTFALAVGVLFDGDPARAGELLAESQAICRASGDRWWLATALSAAVLPMLRLGEVDRAGGYGREALRTRRALHDIHGTTAAVEFLAWVDAADHNPVRAARLLGATDRQWRAIGGSPFGAGQWLREHDASTAAAREALGAARFGMEFRRGAAMELDDAVGYALGDDRPAAVQAHGQADTVGLTRRETEIAELVAGGLSNREIATRLMVSQRTAESHVANILSKLGFASRTQIAAWYVTRR